RLGELLQLSQHFQGQLAAAAGQTTGVEAVVLSALGNDLEPSVSAHDVTLTGRADVGVAFIEDTAIGVEARDRARRFDLFVAGSTWNAEVLRGAGLGPVETLVQGIDPAIFHPGPRLGLFEGRFAVFSGGKLEYRK